MSSWVIIVHMSRTGAQIVNKMKEVNLLSELKGNTPVLLRELDKNS